MNTIELDRISYLTIQSAIEIHKTLGPGLLENVYRPCMIYELRARELEVTSEVKVPVRYKDSGELGWVLQAGPARERLPSSWN